MAVWLQKLTGMPSTREKSVMNSRRYTLRRLQYSPVRMGQYRQAVGRVSLQAHCATSDSAWCEEKA